MDDELPDDDPWEALLAAKERNPRAYVSGPKSVEMLAGLEKRVRDVETKLAGVMETNKLWDGS
jgi:hypothetical protein